MSDKKIQQSGLSGMTLPAEHSSRELKTVLMSKRGFPLMHQEVLEVPVITVENYEKWYSLYMIQPNGSVEEIPVKTVLEAMDDNCWWIDHDFHPALLWALAKQLKAEVPATTVEVVTGRWVLSRGLVDGLGFQYFLDDEEQ